MRKRAPLMPLDERAAKKRWRQGKGRHPLAWKGRRPLRPSARRFSERAPSLRCSRPFAPLSVNLQEHGTFLEGFTFDNTLDFGLDTYGSNISLFSSAALVSNAAVEGYLTP